MSCFFIFRNVCNNSFYFQTRRITAIPKPENAPRENRGMFALNVWTPTDPQCEPEAAYVMGFILFPVPAVTHINYCTCLLKHSVLK